MLSMVKLLRLSLKTNRILTLAVGIAMGFGLASGEDVQRILSEKDIIVKRSPLAINTSMEMGQMVKGEDPHENFKINGDFVSRTGVWLTQRAAIHDIMGMSGGIELVMGAGGLFWYSWPEVEGQTHTRGTKFGPGISQAQAIYKFGDVNAPSATLQMGLFPIKYNPDAVNLGEYLFRSGTYPGFLATGSWNIMNSAGYMGQGIRFNFSHWDDRITHDFTLFMERDYVPQFDFTPSYLLSMDFDFLQIGGGISLSHYLPVKPSRLEPKHELNSYVEMQNFPEIPWVIDSNYVDGGYDTVQYAKAAGPQAGLQKEFENLQDANGNTPFEEKIYTDVATGTQRITREDPAYQADPSLYSETNEYRYARNTTYYSFKGIKLMGRIALDIKEFLPSGYFTPADLRLYAEVALLGVKNYPFYYEKRTERMPVMFGVNLPTLRILDILAIQAEYYSSPFPNNIDNLWKQGLPVWTLPEPEYPQRYNPADYKRDNWKWSVYGKRHITKGMDVFFQIATDHLRTLHYEGRFSYWPISQNPSQWYYMTRIEFGI